MVQLALFTNNNHNNNSNNNTTNTLNDDTQYDSTTMNTEDTPIIPDKTDKLNGLDSLSVKK